jgi:hypothetical protein
MCEAPAPQPANVGVAAATEVTAAAATCARACACDAMHARDNSTGHRRRQQRYRQRGQCGARDVQPTPRSELYGALQRARARPLACCSTATHTLRTVRAAAAQRAVGIIFSACVEVHTCCWYIVVVASAACNRNDVLCSCWRCPVQVPGASQPELCVGAASFLRELVPSLAGSPVLELQAAAPASTSGAASAS